MVFYKIVTVIVNSLNFLFHLCQYKRKKVSKLLSYLALCSVLLILLICTHVYVYICLCVNMHTCEMPAEVKKRY